MIDIGKVVMTLYKMSYVIYSNQSNLVTELGYVLLYSFLLFGIYWPEKASYTSVNKGILIYLAKVSLKSVFLEMQNLLKYSSLATIAQKTKNKELNAIS